MANPLNEHLFQLRVFDSSDDVIAVHDDLVGLFYQKRVNHIGLAIATVPEDHPLLDYAIKDQLIEIFITYKKHPAITSEWGQQWTSDFVGLFRDKQIATDDDGNVYYLLYFPSAMEILSRYIIAWPDGITGKTFWSTLDGPASEFAVIANDIVRWNCTEEATTANGRIRTATRIRNLSDAGAIAGTDVVTYSASNRNVLEALQELAPICGFDFDVIKDTDGAAPQNLVAKQFAGQLGTDKSASIIFDLALDNVATANLNGDQLREKTVAIVGGQGEGSSRTFVTRTGDNFAANNDYEFFVDARTASTTIELNTIGDAKLGELKARSRLDASVAPSFGYVYKRDYGLGDLVTVRLGDVAATRKIDVVEVKFDQNQVADVRIGFEDIAA